MFTRLKERKKIEHDCEILRSWADEQTRNLPESNTKRVFETLAFCSEKRMCQIIMLYLLFSLELPIIPEES